MPTAESLHLADAIGGLLLGVAAAGGALALRQRTAVLALAATAALIAMVVAVGTGLADNVAIGPALSGLVIGGAAGVGCAWLDRTYPPPVVAALVIVSAGGVWLSVPDTEAAVACAAAYLPIAALVMVVGRRRAPQAALTVPVTLGWLAVALMPAWAAVWGASGRSSSLAGALACFGVALVAPWVALVVRGNPPPAAWLLLVQVAVVLFASRWAARGATVGEGALRSIGVLAALVVLGVVSARRRGRGHPPRYIRPEHRR